jgi:hypothetical protein
MEFSGPGPLAPILRHDLNDIVKIGIVFEHAGEFGEGMWRRGDVNRDQLRPVAKPGLQPLI